MKIYIAKLTNDGLQYMDLAQQDVEKLGLRLAEDLEEFLADLCIFGTAAIDIEAYLAAQDGRTTERI